MPWKRFAHYWFIVRIIHQSSVDTLKKGHQCGPFSISSLSGCTRTVEHSVEVLNMGDPIWIWPSGGPAVFSTPSALLWLTVAVFIVSEQICMAMIMRGSSMYKAEYGWLFNPSPTGQNGRLFADDIFGCISPKEKLILLLEVQLTITRQWLR